jgi:hypothetical protein
VWERIVFVGGLLSAGVSHTVGGEESVASEAVSDVASKSGYPNMQALVAAMGKRGTVPQWLPLLNKPVPKPGSNGAEAKGGMEDFFHGCLSQKLAAVRLEGAGLTVGRYMVWTTGSKLGRYELSVVHKGLKIQHHVIERGTNGRFSIHEGKNIGSKSPRITRSKKE